MNAADMHKQVTAALTGLGLDSDQVADALRAKGIKGRRGSECLCPIAIYLGRTVRDIHEVEVQEGELFVQFDGSDGGTESVFVPTPDAIALFVRHFDRGVYLDLVDRGAELAWKECPDFERYATLVEHQDCPLHGGEVR